MKVTSWFPREMRKVLKFGLGGKCTMPSLKGKYRYLYYRWLLRADKKPQARLCARKCFKYVLDNWPSVAESVVRDLGLMVTKKLVHEFPEVMPMLTPRSRQYHTAMMNPSPSPYRRMNPSPSPYK